MLKRPNRTQTKIVWKKVTKKYKVKTICLSSWVHWRKQKWLRKLFAPLPDLLDQRYMFLCYKGKNYIHVPKGTWDKKIKSKSYFAVLLATLAHELTHYLQCRQSDSWTTFYVNYFLVNEDRISYEAAANAAGADVYRALGYTAFINPSMVFDKDWGRMYLLNTAEREQAIEEYKKLVSIGTKRNQCSTVMGGTVVAAIRKETLK